LNRNYSTHLPPGCEFRLPSEKEWIVFAFCGQEKEYPWGNQWPPPNSFNYKGTEGANIIYGFFQNEKFIRNHNDGFVVTAPVGKSGTNEWGLYGVGGNVWEWCRDWFDETKTTRVLKGAAWNNSDPAILTVNHRSGALPEKSNAMIGFRVVIAPRNK
jgi:formylglycine-generating enzyme required for sulfatase activity